MRARLADHDRVTLALDGRRHAGVAILLVDSELGEDRIDRHAFDDEDMRQIPGFVPGEEVALDGRMVDVSGGCAFVLCRRPSRMGRHAGQWALPGGRLEPGESAVEAALRETEEEVGVALDESAVLGVLDDYGTRSGFVMTPVVLWAGPDVAIRPDPGEVLAAYKVGVHHLQRSDSPRFVEIPESDRPVVQIPLSGDLIHAPTGAVLLQFRWRCLDGRPSDDSRVLDLEQPVFAWG
ncbi:MAG: CoA pyrophosphatase [Actinomycetota bacterium]